MMLALLGSIPSPSSGALTIGPLSIHAYGLMIALGVIAAVWLLGRRLEARGEGTREDASSIAVWAVIAGVIGSRLYHVVTDWDNFKHDLGRIPQLWRGGLGIPGGILFGTLAAVWAFRRRGIPPAVGLSAAAPSLALAQAIGRRPTAFMTDLWQFQEITPRLGARGAWPATLRRIALLLRNTFACRISPA